MEGNQPEVDTTGSSQLGKGHVTGPEIARPLKADKSEAAHKCSLMSTSCIWHSY